jgi:putative NADH-flavin reductase
VTHGDVHDSAAVKRAMDGCEAVIDTLGGKTPFLKTDLESSAARVVLAAMKEVGAKRLVAISVLGAGDSGAQAPFWYEHLFLPTFLHGALPDKNEMEAEVKASGVDWVLVRPPILTDKEATGAVKVVTGSDIAHTITRADLAQFLVDQLGTDTYLGQAVVIANS